MSPISPVPFDVRGPSWLGLDLATFKLIERGYVLAGTQLLNEIAAVKLGGRGRLDDHDGITLYNDWPQRRPLRPASSARTDPARG